MYVTLTNQLICYFTSPNQRAKSLLSPPVVCWSDWRKFIKGYGAFQRILYIMYLWNRWAFFVHLCAYIWFIIMCAWALYCFHFPSSPPPQHFRSSFSLTSYTHTHQHFIRRRTYWQVVMILSDTRFQLPCYLRSSFRLESRSYHLWIC